MLKVIKEMTQFDFYNVNIDHSYINLVERLAKDLDLDIERAIPKYGYREAYSLVRGTTKHMLIQSGGEAVGTGTYCSANGHFANEFYAWLVDNKTEYQLIRADVKIDLDGQEYFEQIAKMLKIVALNHRLKTSCMGDWVQTNTGRTLYVGSRQSPVYCRLYEKGHQYSFASNLVRLEFEIKPKKHARLELAGQPAANFLNVNRWVSELISMMTQSTIEPSDLKLGTVYLPSDHERALAHLVKQYQSTIKKQLTLDGGCLDNLWHTLTTHENWKHDDEQP